MTDSAETQAPPALDNWQKMAIILGTLPDDQCVEIMKNFKEEEIVPVCRALLSAGDVDDETRAAVLEEFHQQLGGGGRGGVRVEGLLVRAYGIRRSGELLSRINDAGGDVPTWDQLLEKSGEVVMSEVLSSEHPGIAALVMSSLPPKKAAGLLSKLSEDFQTEALKAMCSGRKIPAELAEKVRRGLADKLSRMKSAGGGVNKEEAKATASLLSQMSSEAARKSLEAVRARDPELASAIESSLLTFVDLLRLDDKDMQRALAKINQNDLKLALRKCDEAVANKIFKNMSDRVVAALKEDIKIMAPQKMAAIQDAQRKIVDIILKMRDAGEIVLKAADGAVSSGGDEEMV